MNNTNVNVLVLKGDGINCENESSSIFQKLGCTVQQVHINKLLKEPNDLFNFSIFVIPGGFSFGDELGSGKILSLKLKTALNKIIPHYLENKGLILGVCNGFQVLSKWILNTATGPEKDFSLAPNKNHSFVNQWVECEVLDSRCIWTKNLNRTINLPARHAEGRFVIAGTEKKKKTTYDQLKNKGRIVLKYKNNFNGSDYSIAGICDNTGQVLGLMPHPEAAINEFINPFGDHKESIKFFNNAVQFAKQYRS